MAYILLSITVLLTGEIEVDTTKFDHWFQCEFARREIVELSREIDLRSMGTYSITGHCQIVKVPLKRHKFNRPVL